MKKTSGDHAPKLGEETWHRALASGGFFASLRKPRTAALFGVLGALLLGSPLASAQDAPKSYDAFKLLRARNIFDPDRKPAPKAEAPRATAPAANRPAGVLLTGTMVTDSRSLAFFGSSRPEYNKVAAPQEAIAEFTITKISPGLIELERAGKQIMVTVGQPLPIEGAEPVTAASISPAPAAAPVDASAPGVPADKNEVLRRMMERRQKENPQ